MTRETKIGLLVGLTFILVVGILLSEHVTRSTEAPRATLVDAADSVRAAVRTPAGHAEPPITVVAPKSAAPVQPVPTRDEIRKPQPEPSPVTPAEGTQVADSRPLPLNDGPLRTETPTSPFGRLERAAAEAGEPIVDVNHPPVNPPVNPVAPAPVGTKAYVAQAGDNLHKIALRTMGASTKANREAIVRLNPSLQKNPDNILVGATYNVPAVETKPQPTKPETKPTTPAASPSVAIVEYEVKAGDNLTKIAAACHTPDAINVIRKLNADTLRGSDVVKIGMKLKLPAK